jgi:hypothetical protein
MLPHAEIVAVNRVADRRPVIRKIFRSNWNSPQLRHRMKIRGQLARRLRR